MSMKENKKIKNRVKEIEKEFTLIQGEIKEQEKEVGNLRQRIQENTSKLLFLQGEYKGLSLHKQT